MNNTTGGCTGCGARHFVRCWAYILINSVYFDLRAAVNVPLCTATCAAQPCSAIPDSPPAHVEHLPIGIWRCTKSRLLAGGLRAFLHWLAPNRRILNPSGELASQDLPFEAPYRGRLEVRWAEDRQRMRRLHVHVCTLHPYYRHRHLTHEIERNKTHKSHRHPLTPFPLKMHRRNPSHPAAATTCLHILTCSDMIPPPLMFYREILDRPNVHQLAYP